MSYQIEAKIEEILGYIYMWYSNIFAKIMY